MRIDRRLSSRMAFAAVVLLAATPVTWAAIAGGGIRASAGIAGGGIRSTIDRGIAGGGIRASLGIAGGGIRSVPTFTRHAAGRRR